MIEAEGIPKHYQPWTKDKKPHFVQAPEWVDQIIRRRLAVIGPAAAFLFETSQGKPVGPNNLRRSWRRVRDWAGLPDWVIPHVLRKSVITQTRQELGIEAASRLANHSDLRVSQHVYDATSLVPYSITKAMEPFDPSRPAGEKAFEQLVGPIVGEVSEREFRAMVVAVLRGFGMLPGGMPEEAREAFIDAQVTQAKTLRDRDSLSEDQ